MYRPFSFCAPLMAAAAALGLAACPAWAAIGAGSLYVPGATTTPTHFNIPIGVAANCEIRGVLASEVGGSLPATLTVYVKSSQFGNTAVTATRIGATSAYAFTYTPPAVAHGDAFDACATTVVAYFQLGQNSNNDLIDDGSQNASSGAAAGLRFVNALGAPLDCHPVGVESTVWSRVKALYN